VAHAISELVGNIALPAAAAGCISALCGPLAADIAKKGDLNSLCEKRVAQFFDSRGNATIARRIYLPWAGCRISPWTCFGHKPPSEFPTSNQLHKKSAKIAPPPAERASGRDTCRHILNHKEAFMKSSGYGTRPAC
jgi:hypothetical protein